MKYYLLSEQSFTIDFEKKSDCELSRYIHTVVQYYHKYPIHGITDIVPAATTISFFYDIHKILETPQTLAEIVFNQIEKITPSKTEASLAVVKIPICMHPSFGLDTDAICNTKKIRVEELKEIFLQKTYTVSHLGFLPGFPYILGLNEKLHLPRKATPLSQVPAGSVAIANNNIGIYPFQSPGGWHILGRTPVQLYNPFNNTPFLLQAGSQIMFEEIDLAHFEFLQQTTNHQLSIPATQNPTIVFTKCIGINTIQAKPRIGQLANGVPKAGAMLPRMASQLHSVLSNQKELPLIEIAMGSLQLKVVKPCSIAFAGAVQLTVNNTRRIAYTQINLKPSDFVTVSYNGEGIYGYLALKGLLDLPLILNSYSTSINAQMGYLIKVNDAISIIPQDDFLDKTVIKEIKNKNTIRCFKGPEFDYLTEEAKKFLIQKLFTIDLQANRMAIKLQGEKINTKLPVEMISTAVATGTVQLTPSGQLMILMNDAQTTGGYPRVLQVAAVDIELLALHKPGDTIQFEMISFEKAYKLLKKED